MLPSWKYTLAADMPVGQDWEFARALSAQAGEPFRVLAVDGRIHVARWRRIASYFAVALRLFAHRREMSCLVSWQQFFGLTFAWLCSLLRVKRPNLNNVEMLHGTFDDDMLRLMARASVVAISTDDVDVSSGQLVALQAMALGKAVVATRSAALDDYIDDGENGLLVDKDAAALRHAIDKLMGDPALKQRMGEAGRRRFAERHTAERLAEAVWFRE